ncbi:MAG TPA: protein-L-isoaspartate(D-aspartate) O-methyltransferase [Alphaproteobacteria bacterium]|nr:protein-L-isoaspartate(D-aspartate) O-methyltransferase [Alphaproteobacteria bacterium]
MSTDARKIRLLMSLRRSGVADAKVLGAIERVPRERFVPEAFQDRAWDDTALPIGHGQTISQPLIVALMTEALKVDDRCKVLEIGTGSGYQTAVLAGLARRVYTIETIKPLQDEAAKLLEELRIHNVTMRHGDGTQGWPKQAPFDRIIVTAASGGDVPQALIDQLGEGGILVCPVRRASSDQMVVRICRENDSLKHEDLWPVRFVPLVTGGKAKPVRS